MNKSLQQRAGGHPTSTKTQSLIPCRRGKYKLVSKVAAIVKHAAQAYGLTSYREWCGGGGRILMNLPADLFKEERWYNDIDQG